LFLVTVSANAQTSPSSWNPCQLLENALLFHPLRADESWVVPDEWVQDVWLQTPDGTRIHAWWLPCRRSSGALLFCHGNAGNLSHRLQAVLALRKALSESVLIFDYPGYGQSDGKPSETGCYVAADAAYDWLTQQQGIAPEAVILFGESLGGGVATDLAAWRPHRALVLVKTFTSIPDVARQHTLTWASSSLVHNQFDNLEKIG
jgi:pimeloyl-ACP methyl ester carboxylesterase